MRSFLFARASVSVRLEGGGMSKRDGAIIGGKVIASWGISSHTVGAPMTKSTWVGIGRDLGSDARLVRVQRALEFCDSNILQLFRTLGIKQLDRESIQGVIRRTPEGRREVAGQMVQKLRDLIVRREKSLREASQLESGRSEILTSARILVSGHLYPDVQVTFEDALIIVKEPLDKVSFHVTDDEVVGTRCGGENSGGLRTDDRWQKTVCRRPPPRRHRRRSV